MMLSETIIYCSLFTVIQGRNAGDQKLDKCVKICPEDWEKNGGRCYLWQNDPKIWSDAEKFCKESDAHLASVTRLIIHNSVVTTSGPKLSQLEDLFGLGGQIKRKKENGSGVMGVSGILPIGWSTGMVSLSG